LAALGYDAEWHVIPASGLGAPHDRERVWIIASDARRALGQLRFELFLGRRFTRTGEAAAIVADHYRERELQSGWRFTDQRGRVVYDPEQSWPETWVDKLASLRSMDDGLPAGLSTSTAERFGNSVIPQIPELIGRAILERMAA
jgi:DNA (cytosine-5)-methyltransferase 1